MSDPIQGGNPPDNGADRNGTQTSSGSGNSEPQNGNRASSTAHSNAQKPNGSGRVDSDAKASMRDGSNAPQKNAASNAGADAAHHADRKVVSGADSGSSQNSESSTGKRRRRRRRRGKRSGASVEGAVTNAPSNSGQNNHLDSVPVRHRRAPVRGTAEPGYSVDESVVDESGTHRQQARSESTNPKRSEKNKRKENWGRRPAQFGGGKGRSAEHKDGRKKDRALYGALDLGTNNCRLLVATPQGPGRFRVVDAFSRIVRLGEGLGSTGALNEAAMARAIEALKSCRDKLANRDVKRYRLIATQACRFASNGADFLERVKSETGLELEIVDQETEARLAVSGCGSLIDREADGVVLFDIGGGSSELALLDTSQSQSKKLTNRIASWVSLPLGVVTLSEKHGGRHVTPQVFDAMVDDVSELLHAFEGRDVLDHAHNNGKLHLLGTSGTVTTLAGIHLKLPRYDRRKVDGIWLSDKDCDRMIAELLAMDFDQRVANPCIGADRADLVLAGCAILEAIRKIWPSPRLRVADRGLREGILTELMEEDGAWRRRRSRNGPWRRPRQVAKKPSANFGQNGGGSQ